MIRVCSCFWLFVFFQAEDGIRCRTVTGVQTCALPILQPGGGQRGSEDVLGDGGVRPRVEVRLPVRMAPGPLLEEEVVVVALGQLVGLVDIERRAVAPRADADAARQVDEGADEDQRQPPGHRSSTNSGDRRRPMRCPRYAASTRKILSV